MSHYKYWGKSDDAGDFHLLAYHSLDVAAVGSVLLERDGALARRFARLASASEQSVVRWLSWLLVVHDIGKFYDGFQDLRPDIVERLQGSRAQTFYAPRHDSSGHHFWQLELGRHLAQGPGVEIRLNDELLHEDDVRRVLDPWVRAVTGHHGAPPRTEQRPISPPKRVVADALSFVEATFALWELPELSLKSGASCEDVLGNSAWLVSGFAVMCDWLGSNRQFFPYHREKIELGEYWARARRQAEDVIRWAGVLPCQTPVEVGMARLFPGYDPTPLQRLVDTVPISSTPTLVIVEELTGAGKTEAALAMAQRMIASGAADGIYFALPSMATANAMHQRIESVANRYFAPNANPSLVLAHSASQLRSALHHESPGDRNYDPNESTASIMTSAWLADNRKKALLASLGVGTIDQALLGILPARHSTLRLLGLHRKVLIVDEVHAYDTYTGSLLERLLLFHGAFGGSAILLSATLPASVRKRLIQAFSEGVGADAYLDPETAYPLVTMCQDQTLKQMPVETRDGSARRVEVKMVDSDEAVLKLLASAANRGQCACWIRNSVDDAIEAYELLRELVDPDRTTLFHARFILADRLAIENRVIRHFGKESTGRERAGRIVVATQVVEQSLDLDFDVMVSDLAPIDLIVQRVGRLRRHSRRKNGDPSPSRDERGKPVLILRIPTWTEQPESGWVLKALPRSSYIYPDHGRLWLTAKTLRRLGNIRLPEEARELIESVYGAEAVNEIPQALEERTDRAWAKDRGDASLAHLNALELRDGYCATPQHWLDDTRTPTRLGEISTTLRLAQMENGGLIPIVSHGSWAWAMSQVDVPDYRVHDRPRDERELEAVIEKAEAAMPDKGKWSLTLPVRREGETWVGAAVDRDGRAQKVTYCKRHGLRVFKEGSM